jgi:hypothetical protein
MPIAYREMFDAAPFTVGPPATIRCAMFNSVGLFESLPLYTKRSIAAKEPSQNDLCARHPPDYINQIGFHQRSSLVLHCELPAFVSTA